MTETEPTVEQLLALADKTTTRTLTGAEGQRLRVGIEQAATSIERVRDAAHLHRQGLLSIAELYAVIGPALS